MTITVSFLGPPTDRPFASALLVLRAGSAVCACASGVARHLGARWRFVVWLRPICQWIDPRTLKAGKCLIAYRIAEKSSSTKKNVLSIG